MRFWIRLHTDVSSRYQIAATKKISKVLKSAELMSDDVLKSSVTPITLSSEVCLSIVMNSLPSGGTTTRAAWGRITSRIVGHGAMPTVFAASHWPRSIAPIAARKISLM